MFASIGFPCVTNKTTVEEMHAAFYSILDLASKIVASEPYLKITNRKGEYVLLPHMEPFPGAFEAPQIQLELPVIFHQEGSAYGNPHEPKTEKI